MNTKLLTRLAAFSLVAFFITFPTVSVAVLKGNYTALFAPLGVAILTGVAYALDPKDLLPTQAAFTADALGATKVIEATPSIQAILAKIPDGVTLADTEVERIAAAVAAKLALPTTVTTLGTVK